MRTASTCSSPDQQRSGLRWRRLAVARLWHEGARRAGRAAVCRAGRSPSPEAAGRAAALGADSSPGAWLCHASSRPCTLSPYYYLRPRSAPASPLPSWANLAHKSAGAGEQAQRLRKRAEGWGYLSPYILNPACLMAGCPNIAANYAGIRRVGAIVKGDGYVIARPPVDRDVKGLLNIKPGQVTRAGHAAVNDVEQCRIPEVVRAAVLIQEVGLPAHPSGGCAGNRAGPQTRERLPTLF